MSKQVFTSVNDLLWLKENIIHEIRQCGDQSSEEISWYRLLVEVYDTIAENTGHAGDRLTAMTARLRSAAKLPNTDETLSWRAEARKWLWDFIESFRFDEVAADLTQWRTLPHERIRQIGLLRNVLADYRSHPEFIASLPQEEKVRLLYWLSLPPMN